MGTLSAVESKCFDVVHDGLKSKAISSDCEAVLDER